jgi:shikimate kinase/3-dehydroquinate synthase
VTAANLILTGMMGTGKTTVGRELARRRGVPFEDLDALIAGDSGDSVAELFAREGEAAFRARERAATLALAPTPARVIATGGWTLADPASRAHLATLGPVVCLTAETSTLADRLAAAGETRPLLATPDLAAIAALLAQRRPVYDSLPLQVDTTRLTVAEAAAAVERVIALAGALALTALPVQTPEGGYRVVIGSGVLAAVGALLAGQGRTGRTLLVTDSLVAPLYADRVMAALRDADLTTTLVVMGIGEAAKSLATVAALYDACLASGLDRDGTIVALGGGVVTDTAGYAAATWLRGVHLVTVPTTLLGMVDAAIGGKSGVNLAAGKNLVGAFKQPDLVLADPTVLATLPPPVLRAGLAEVVKAALVADPALFAQLEVGGVPGASDAPAWCGLVARAAAVKVALVASDPYEQSRRVVLNLGHTFGHALERATDYRLSHGEAVAIGLVAACTLAERLGLAESGLAPRVAALLTALGLPTCFAGPTSAAVLAAMVVDKKRAAGRLRFVVPRAVGDVVVVDDVATADVLGTLDALREG